MVNNESTDIFNKIKDNISNIDPVAFCEKYLMVDGRPFRLTGNGYRPFCEIYRYIAIKALNKDAKPVILVKGRQTGASTMASALEMYFMGSGLFGTQDRPPIRIVHAWPALDYAYGYTKTKLNAMINSSKIISPLPKKGLAKSYMKSLLDPTSETNDSMQFKQFVGGNHIFIESCGLEGERLRSKTADVIFFDEVQDMPQAAIANSLKILTKAQYGAVGEGIQVFFGTPKQRSSNYWDMWSASSQQYYYLGCEKCEKHFPLYTPGSNDWENIWLHDFIVKCTHCGHEQDKRPAAERGKWIGTKDPSECKLIGFHINQLYIPDFTKEKIIAEKPENHHSNTERAYQNEVLGEFYQGEAGIMTPDQIREICGDPGRKFRAGIQPGDNKLSFLGIDIGAKSDIEQMIDTKKVAGQGQSYSTAVILTVSGHGLLSIDFASKFKRNDLESKKSFVNQMIKQYNVNLAVCDIGYANSFNEIMQHEHGHKFLASRTTGKLNGHIKYNDDIFPKEIVFEKDFYIAELYEQMKKGQIRFPLGSYDAISWLINHCTSMEIKPTLDRSGGVNTHYVKGSTPNDGFCSLLNAYIAYKYYVSNGFTIKDPMLFGAAATKHKPMIVGAYLPKMR